MLHGALTFFKSPNITENKNYQSNYDLFLQLPKALCDYVLIPYFDLETKTEFAIHSEFSKDPIFKKTLWECIAHGEEKLAEKILKVHPEWLFEKNTVTDLSGRTIVNVTPFQLAFGGHDVEMCQMMLPFTKDKESEILGQIHERFRPFSVEEKSYDFSKLIEAVTSKDEEKIENAFHHFKEDFKPRKIEKGWHFNVQNLCVAAKIASTRNKPWSPDQYDLFLAKCVGYLQYQLPVSYAQAYCNGLLNIIHNNKKVPIKRSLMLDNGASFYDTELLGESFIISSHPILDNISSAVRIEKDITICCQDSPVRFHLDHSVYLDKLHNFKKAGMRQLVQELDKTQSHRCIMC